MPSDLDRSGSGELYVLAAGDNPFSDDAKATKDLFDRLRRQGHRRITDPGRSVIWILRAADADELLALPQLRSEMATRVLDFAGVADGPLRRLWASQMFAVDGPAHKRLRSSVARALTPRGVKKWQSEIRDISDNLLSAWTPNMTVEIFRDYAVPLTSESMCAVLGVPRSDAGLLADWGLSLVKAFGILDESDIGRLDQAASEVTEYLERHLTAGVAPRGSLLASITSTTTHGLSRDEIVAVLANLVFGGLDATSKSVTTGLALLVTSSYDWSDLMIDPEHASRAVDEVLRFSPPVAGVARYAAEPAVCSGLQIHAGQIVVTSLDAICRDEEQHRNPDTFDIDRQPTKLHAFGAGPHYCLGANLARLIVETGIAAVAAQFPNLELTERFDQLPWEQSPVRGIVRLPVRLRASSNLARADENGGSDV